MSAKDTKGLLVRVDKTQGAHDKALLPDALDEKGLDKVGFGPYTVDILDFLLQNLATWLRK